MWINPTLLDGNHTFFYRGSAGTNTLLHIRLGGPNAEWGTPVNGLRFAFYNNDLDIPTESIQVDTWYHIACVHDYENGARRIYLDGVEVASQESGAAAFGCKRTVFAAKH